MRLPAQFAIGASGDLDAWISTAEAPGGGFDARALYDADLCDAFPTEAVRALEEFGLARFYVPKQFGGLLASIPELLQLWRVVARRDLTVAVAHGKTFLGSICVWVSGHPDQARALGAAVAAGMVVSWGLTERGRGSDLMRTAVTLRSAAPGWKLDGEKWLINNATRGHAICVLARSRERLGPGSLSVVLVEKSRIDRASYECLPKELTLGIRGADISGIVFRQTKLEPGALVGVEGQGLELVLRSLQVTRTLCTGLSLGALDHALSIALRFARSRVIHGRALIEFDMAAGTLAHAELSRRVTETVADVAGRCMHVFPEEMSVISALCKAFIPPTVEGSIAALAELVGLRSFVADHDVCEALEKIERDHRIVPIFDGSTVVTRNSLVSQFPILSRAYERQQADLSRCMEAAGTAPLATITFDELRVLSPGGCSLVQSLPSVIARLRSAAGKDASLESSAALAAQVVARTASVIERARAIIPKAQQIEARAFDVARDYELCFAASACLLRWLAAYEQSEGPPYDARWLAACLDWILSELAPDHDTSPESERWALEQLQPTQER